jgi:hypothetical protein
MSLLKVNSLQDLSSDAIITEGVIAASALPAGGILQVVSTTKTDPFTTASTTFVDLTGLSVSITPRSISSKIYVSFTSLVSGDGNIQSTMLRLMRDSTAVGIGDASASRSQISTAFYAGNDASNVNSFAGVSSAFVDSPATTSSLTYKVQIRTSGDPAFVNRGNSDSDSPGSPRGVSTITVMEVAG